MIKKPLATARVSSVFRRRGAIVAQNNDYTATQIKNIPAGSISGVNVQTALNELDAGKLGSVQEDTDPTLSGTVTVESLKHSDPGGRRVYVSSEGILYSVMPPTPGWSANDSDTGTYDLGSGSDTGPWIEIALDVNTGGDLALNDRIDVAWTLYIENQTSNRTGLVEVGFSIDAGTISAGGTVGIPAGFDGYTSGGFTTAAIQAYPTGTNISLYARRTGGSHNQYHPIVQGGSGANTHELFVSVPS